jgi:hypothetical protein
MCSYLNLAFGLNLQRGPAGHPTRAWPSWLVPRPNSSWARTCVVKPNLTR